ncbi:hypothetical protein [Roseibium limicola]|uniref:Uncharacterized protein n=1 Tax=Roseibium limicola TaxID=2816037 RepID=A0A939EMD1_9HYPH|nr:hypothetical protein [Roseibium limicola]MBO0345088.1 hypothetical protein [Roseibium limicola]
MTTAQAKSVCGLNATLIVLQWGFWLKLNFLVNFIKDDVYAQVLRVAARGSAIAFDM